MTPQSPEPSLLRRLRLHNVPPQLPKSLQPLHQHRKPPAHMSLSTRLLVSIRNTTPLCAGKATSFRSETVLTKCNRTYWYYFYTRMLIAASTTTSRYLTTVTKTTILTCQATAFTAAEASFSAMSHDLPTPSDAQVTIARTPTPGALIIGSCVPTSISGSATSVCETDIAASSTGSTGSTTSSGSTSYDGASMSIASTWKTSKNSVMVFAMFSGVLMMFM